MKNTTQVTNVSIKEGPIQIGIATTPEEKREVYQLRYKVYAEEIGYKLEDVDHQNKLLYDELDDWGILITAHIGLTLIGTVRINIGKISDFSSDLVETYCLDRFMRFYSKKDDPHFTIISRGLISPQYRSSTAFYLLITKIYELCYDHNVQFCFLNCTFHLISFYEHTGQIRINKNTIDSNDKSPLTSLVLLVDDIDHLRSVRSPLFRIIRRKNITNKKAVNWFYSEFAQEIEININTQLTNKETLWNMIWQYLGILPNYKIPFLNELTTTEAKIFLHFCSTIVHCHAGDYLTSRGSTSQEFIILLSGKAYSSLIGNLYPGQTCGENGLVCFQTHSSNIISMESSKILVISSYAFCNFRKRHPNIAYKILANMCHA